MTNTIKTVDELREALEAVKTAEQAEAALNSTTIQTLKKYVKEEDYYFCKPISKLTKADIVDALKIDYADKTEAEPTLEELEQETGFTYCRRLGQEFLSGEVSLGQLTNQIESLKRSFKYGDNSGTLHGLAYAFGIAMEGKSCEELLSEIEKFVSDKAVEQLSEQIKAIHSYDWMTKADAIFGAVSAEVLKAFAKKYGYETYDFEKLSKSSMIDVLVDGLERTELLTLPNAEELYTDEERDFEFTDENIEAYFPDGVENATEADFIELHLYELDALNRYLERKRKAEALKAEHAGTNDAIDVMTVEQVSESLRIKDEACKRKCSVYEYLMYHSTCDSLRTLIGIFEINDRQGYDTDNYESFLDYAVDVIERKVI